MRDYIIEQVRFGALGDAGQRHLGEMGRVPDTHRRRDESA